MNFFQNCQTNLFLKPLWQTIVKWDPQLWIRQSNGRLQCSVQAYLALSPHTVQCCKYIDQFVFDTDSVQCCTVLYCTLPLRCEGNPSAKHRYTAAQAQVSVASVSGLLIGQWRRNIVIWLADRNTGDTLLVSYPLAPQAGAALLVLACFDILLNIFLLKLKQTPADPTEHACPSLLGKAKLFIFQ